MASASLQRHDTASSMGRGRVLLQKMYSTEEPDRPLPPSGGDTSALNISRATPPRTSTFEERKRLVASPRVPRTSVMDERKRFPSAQAVKRVLEKSKSSSTLMASGPPPPVPAKLDFDVDPEVASNFRASNSSFNLRKTRSMGPETGDMSSILNQSFIGRSPMGKRVSIRGEATTAAVAASSLRKSRSMGADVADGPSFLNRSGMPSPVLARLSVKAVPSESSTSATSSMTPSPQQPQLEDSVPASSANAGNNMSFSRIQKRSSSSASSSSRPSPVKNQHALNLSSLSSTSSRPNASPSKRVLLSSVLETSTEEEEVDGSFVRKVEDEEEEKILQVAGRRSRGFPVTAPNGDAVTSNQQLPSPIEPAASSRTTSPIRGHIQQNYGKLDLTSNHSPLETSTMVNVTMASPMNTTARMMTASEQKRRQSQRNNERELNASMLLREPQQQQQQPTKGLQAAFDEPSPEKKNTERENIPNVVSFSKRLNRFSRSAPNTVAPSSAASPEIPAKPVLARFKATKSPLKENLSGGGILASEPMARPSPSQVRDLFRKSLAGPQIVPKPATSIKRKTKEDRIAQFIDSAKELRALAMEDGGLLRGEFRKTAWPSLLADASRRIPTATQGNLNDSDLASDNGSSGMMISSSDIGPLSEKDHHQIDLDVERKYEEGESGQRERLRKFLHAFFYNHPELCYFQGFHDLCALVLKVFDDDLVADFVVFKISTSTLIRDAHRPTMDATFAELKAVFFIIECADPELAEKLRTTIGTESYWGISMLTCLFSHDVADEESIERLVDSCIAGGPHFPMYLVAGLALLPKTRLYLMSCDYDETAVLGALRQDARAITMAEADELVRFAQILQRRVPPAKVVDYCYKKLELPVDSFLASRWLMKTSKWVFGLGSQYKVRERPLGE